MRVSPASSEGGHFNPENLTAAQTQACLDIFHTAGTHFVSKITVGEVIFQVFAYPSDRFQNVKKAYASNDFTGENAVAFAMFTTDANTGAYGYVKEFGNILSMSGDASLQKSLRLVSGRTISGHNRAVSSLPGWATDK